MNMNSNPKTTDQLKLLPVIFLLMAMAPFSVALAQTSFPDTPLQTSANRPAANIMFILDDSGSMEFDYMPDGMTDNDFNKKNYFINPLAYDPTRNYTTWKNYDQTLMTGGTLYTAVYDHPSLRSGSANLWLGTQVFYAPKTSAVSRGNTTKSNYYEYKIFTNSSNVQIYQRCEYKSSSGKWETNCINTTAALPLAARNKTAELINYATWYSYHRTRMKVAKAGVSEAFSQLNGGVRLGYDTIWNRSPLNIPVGTDNGLFRDANKQTWFNRVMAADGGSGTPLHGALTRAGQYFKGTAATGPYGPEAGAAQYTCRQNFAILTTDGYWNKDDNYTSSSVLVGNADGTNGVEIVSSKGEKYTYTPKRPYTDAFSDTLADVAAYYWKTDLRTDAAMVNNVPASVNDPAFWQHMVTFGISIGLQGTLNPKTDLPSITNGSKVWLDPWKTASNSTRSYNNESSRRIDDLWHASVNGRGSFSAATSPDEFTKSLKNALGNIQKTLSSGSNVSTSSTSLQTDTRIFHATYYSGIWTGEMAAFDISSAGVAQEPSWVASEKIVYATRKVFTINGTSGAAFPTTAQAASLYAGLADVTVTGTDIANYIKGSRTKEVANGGTFRNRESIVGDIVNSSPIYSPDTDTLFIGSNDGMMHSVNATTGAEYFSYVPKGLNFNNLGTIANPDYSHKYFVDGRQAVSIKKQTPGKNYLIGALGRGGKGVYGLDVTAPATFSAADVLWDNTGSADLDMGYVTGEMIISKTNTDVDVAIVSNGIDSTNGRAVLYIINLETGVVIKKIDTGAGSGNGLSSPRGWDVERDGKVDYIYAGDLKGNLWKFDISSTNMSDWKVSFSGEPLFIAKDSLGNRQPITGGLALGLEAFGDNRWILFGTGKYIQQSDITDASSQTVYGIIDSGVKVARADLKVRTLAIVQQVGTQKALRSFETYSPLPSGKKGWLLDLSAPYSGERVVERGFLSGRVFVFPSIVPVSGNPCESSGKGFVNAIDGFTGTSVNVDGSNHAYFDVGNDGSSANDTIGTAGVGPGLLPVGSIETDIGMVTKPVLVGGMIVYGGSSGGRGTTTVHLPPASARRLSWREVVQ